MLRMVLESHTLCENPRAVKADVPLARNSTACPFALLNHLPEVPDLATPARGLTRLSSNKCIATLDSDCKNHIHGE